MSTQHQPHRSHPGHQVSVAYAYRDCSHTASLICRLPFLSPPWHITFNTMLADKRRGGGREGGRGGEDGKGAAGRRRTERKFQNCRCLVIALTSPPPTRQLQNTHWKAVTKFSHIGFLSVLKPKKKNYFVRFISCATVLDKRWLGLHLKTYRELSMKNLEMAQGRHSALRCGLTYNKSVVNNVKSVRKG